MINPEEARELVDIRPKWSNSEIRPFKDVETFLKISEVLQGELAQKSLEARKRFLDFLLIPDFHLMDNDEKAAAVGVSTHTLAKWMIQCPDEYLAEALKIMREKNARHSMRVDAALIREATVDGGDAKHKELYYRRQENWNPAQNLELSRGRDKELDSKANFELLKALVAGLSAEEKAELLGQGGIPPVDGNVERLEGPGEGGEQ